MDAVLEIQRYIPTKIMVFYDKGHQDRLKRKEQHTMVDTLNIKADKIIGKHTIIPKSIHIRKTIMSVYINKTYIPNNIRREIRNHCGVQEAARFLKEKYK